ncbi:MAG: B12-binding domain-containing radical SAM protein, partial [bacterium]
MKILLLKPINSIYYVIQPNIGLGVLATIMENNNHNVHIIDAAKEKLKWDDFVSLIKKEKFDLIGIQMFTHEVPSVEKSINLIKKYLPDATIIIGGSHISGDPEGTMKLLNNVDFGFVGEAETGVDAFLKISKGDYDNYEVLRKIPNLVWRQYGKVVVNNKEYIRDLDAIEFPAWHLMPPVTYPTAPHGSFCKRTPVAPIIVSRGCPFLCTFCAGHCITGRNIRYRTVKNVIDEILLLYHKYGVREIHIEDDNFTLDKKYVVDFSNEIIKLRLDISFALPNGVRLDTIDEEVLPLMEKAGFYSMAVGIESGSDKILQLMKKRTSVKVIKEKIDLIKKHTNIKLTGFFLMGYPEETETDILETISFATSLNIDKASFMFVMPLPGTELWNTYKQNNKAV